MKTGLVEHSRKTRQFLFLESDGIRSPDMTTNIIRLNLIVYTQQQCELLGIPLTAGVPSGFFWDVESLRWEQELTSMLVINKKQILLVPKGVVSYVKEFDTSKYHQHHALEFLQEDHLRRNTRLVQVRYKKDGSIRRRFVTKKDIIKEDLPSDKVLLANFTAKYPKIFSEFRKSAAAKIEALPNAEFENIDVNKLIDHLISKLKNVNEGNKDASVYHSLMIGILELILLSKSNQTRLKKERLTCPVENELTYRLIMESPAGGFFYRLQANAFRNTVPLYVFFECKNYTADVANPELDQITGRLSPNRGKFGVIVCRKIDDEALFLQRCADSYKAQRGLVIPLTDVDIIDILEKRKQGVLHSEDDILSDKAREVMNM